MLSTTLTTPSLLYTLLALVSIAQTSRASTLQSRAVINHDAVAGFPETVPSTLAGQLYLKYKPYLKVFNGCVPFPAVDADGNTSGGLEPSGHSSDGCSKSTGQVYVRGSSETNNTISTYAIMYSWYMPKDSPSDGLGHRHDWENAVVWLDAMSEEASIVAISASGHGDYTTLPPQLDLLTDATHPRIGYLSFWPINHQLIHTTEQGGQQPLVAWESLTEAARTALVNTDFGHATVPFKDDTLKSNFNKVDFQDIAGR